MAALGLALLLFALPVAAALLLWRHLQRSGVLVPWRRTLGVMTVGCLFALLCAVAEQRFLQLAGLSLEASPRSGQSALLTMLLFAVPLEEAAKVIVVWPLYVRHKLTDRHQGLLLGVLVGCAFAGAEAAWQVLQQPLQLVLPARLAMATLAHAFAAGLWGYALGRGRGRWFFAAFLLAVAVRGLHDHIVFGRGPGMLALALPMSVVMVGLGWAAIRDIDPKGAQLPVPLISMQPPPLRTLRRALQRSEKRLRLRWIAVGAFVTAGAILVCLTAGVLLGHRLGVDFALADEADARSNGPLILLGSSVMCAFPIAGYLVSRASNASSVLEAALGASLTITTSVLLLTMAAPVAVLFALATAPIAFLLVCLGAWFGLAR